MGDQDAGAEEDGVQKIGARERRIVQTYLRSLSRRASKGARTRDDVVAALRSVSEKLETAVDLERLALLQEREELELEAYEMDPNNTEDLEEQFIAIARPYGEVNGISYSTWREIGVQKEILESAGVPRTRRKVPKSWSAEVETT